MEFLNLKKGKTEFVLYGSSKKLSTQPDISININNTVINEVTTYRYLGVSLDNHLTLQQFVIYTKRLQHVLKCCPVYAKALVHMLLKQLI